MTEEIELILADADEKMDKTLAHLDEALAHIRAGKASPRLLDGIMVDYYGSMTPLSQVSSVNTPDGRTIAIQPWEKAMIVPIEKAIMNSDLGITPENNGELIRINIPPLTEERRKDLVKQVKGEGEDAKIAIRNSRRDANDMLKKLQKDGAAEDIIKDSEADVQKKTDAFIKKVDAMVVDKEQEILKV